MTTRPDPRPLTRAAWWLARPTIHSVGRLLWRLRVEGEAFPEPPFVIAANHHSFLDPAVVGASYGKRQRFITLVDLFGNYRLLDWTLQIFEVIRIRRDSVPLAAMREALDHLGSGGVVTVFPEGTRVGQLGEIAPRPGAAWLAARAEVPLVPVLVQGTDRVLGVDNKLHRGQIRVVVGRSLHPRGKGRTDVGDLSRRWADEIGSMAQRSR